MGLGDSYLASGWSMGGLRIEKCRNGWTVTDPRRAHDPQGGGVSVVETRDAKSDTENICRIVAEWVERERGRTFSELMSPPVPSSGARE